MRGCNFVFRDTLIVIIDPQNIVIRKYKDFYIIIGTFFKRGKILDKESEEWVLTLAPKISRDRSLSKAINFSDHPHLIYEMGLRSLF